MSYFIILIFYRAADAVKHFQLYWRGDHFAFGHGIYDNVEELADHFDNKPLLGGESGTCVVTLVWIEPFSRQNSSAFWSAG